MCNQCLKEKIDRVVLRTRIVRAYPSIRDLRLLCEDLTQMLLLKGRDDLISPDLLGGNELEEKVLSLIEFFDKNDMLPDLIEVVCAKRPYLKHHDFYLKYARSDTYRLLNSQHFDLNKIVEPFFKIVRENQGVICFAMPCDYSEFHEIFCRRIEDELEHLPEF